MMFNYNTLSHSRKHFVDTAIKVFPELMTTKQITRSEIQAVCAKTGINPAQWLCVSANSVSRGVFHFPVPTESSNHTNEDIVVMEETDEEILTRINARFNAIDSCVRSVAAGDIKSLILAGAPGLGKSHEVNKTLQELDDNATCDFVFVSGKTTATGLFKLLYDNRFPGTVLVIDDMDSVFSSEDSLNILKKALDLKPVRKISWLSEAKLLSEEDGAEIPKHFDYEGSVIFITNKDIDNLMVKDTKLSPHLEALVSRSLYINIGVKTTREILIRIKQVLGFGMLRDKGFSETEEDEIYNFVCDNADYLRELSLRMVEKLSILYRANPTDWHDMARITCFKK